MSFAELQFVSVARSSYLFCSFVLFRSFTRCVYCIAFHCYGSRKYKFCQNAFADIVSVMCFEMNVKTAVYSRANGDIQ